MCTNSTTVTINLRALESEVSSLERYISNGGSDTETILTALEIINNLARNIKAGLTGGCAC